MKHSDQPSMTRVSQWWRSGLRSLLIGIMTLLLAIMMVQVVMRYGFNNSLIWAEELCRYLLVAMSMLGLAFAYERGEIAAVRMALHAMPRRPAFIVAITGNLLSAGLCLMLVYYGLRYASIAGSQPVPAIRFILSDIFGEGRFAGPAMFWVYAVLPLGMLMLGLRILADIPRYLRAMAGKATLSDLDYDVQGEEA
jgi:TRAP-type C4-dicarboxylate transport system permease small subunit